MTKACLKKRPRQQKRAPVGKGNGAQIVIACSVVLGLFAGWMILAYSGVLDSLFTQKGKKGGPISVQSFNANSPSKEYIYGGGRLVATEEPASSILTAPVNLRASATTSTTIHISWNAVAGAAWYELQRSSNYDGENYGFVPVQSNLSQTATDDTVGSNAAYLYRVRAYDAPYPGGNASTPSNIDLATAITFSEDPVQPSMLIRDFHILRLRDAVNYVRTTAGLGLFNTWTDPSTLAQVVIKKEHVQELRDKLGEAGNKLAFPQPSYTDSTINPHSTRVQAAHVQELRRLVKGYLTAIDNP